MEREREAFRALAAGGGRPIHPIDLLHTVLAAPGEHRDILTYWQDRPGQWQIFTKQLTRWKEFRVFQASEREKYTRDISHYAQRIRAYLGHQHGFEFPASFRTSEGGFHADPACQGKLATWIEYLYYEYRQHDSYKRVLEDHEPSYHKACAALIDSRVLDRSEHVERSPLELCTPSSLEITRRNYEKQTVGSHLPVESVVLEPLPLPPVGRQVQARVQPVNLNKPLPSPPWSREASPENASQLNYRRGAQLSPEARQDLERRRERSMLGRERMETERKAQQVLSFKMRTTPYRLARNDVERHRACLRWALAQVPLIVKEEADAQWGLPGILPSIEGVDGLGLSQTATPTFPRFCELPFELRHQIWMNCLPPRPTAHFFDVLNHPRKRHLAKYWSTEEFRVAATNDHDSGYKTVYRLLAACSESRDIVASYYKALQQPNTTPTDPDLTSAWKAPYTAFQTFNWIPADDLVVLCFPPKQRPLPAQHAITFSKGPARSVGIYLPVEMAIIAQFGRQDQVTDVDLSEPDDFDDEIQLLLVGSFLKSLRDGAGDRGGGIKNIHVFAEGWHTMCWKYEHLLNPPVRGDRRWLQKARIASALHWRFNGAREAETRMSLRRVPGLPMRDPAGCSKPFRRDWWWLGSGDDALGIIVAEDSVERSPARALWHCAQLVWDGCASLGWSEFRGGDVLGRMGSWD